VTTCIASINEPDFAVNRADLIITVSDTRLSFGGSYSIEGVVKTQPFFRQWSVLMAGNDMAQHALVLEKAKLALRGKSG
jgi:hypothetical protein